MPNPTPENPPPAAAAGAADLLWSTPRAHWRETMAAALRVLDHHLANLNSRSRLQEDAARADASTGGQPVDAGPR
jgi:hypothetical protein